MMKAKLDIVNKHTILMQKGYIYVYVCPAYFSISRFSASIDIPYLYIHQPACLLRPITAVITVCYQSYLLHLGW